MLDVLVSLAFFGLIVVAGVYLVKDIKRQWQRQREFDRRQERLVRAVEQLDRRIVLLIDNMHNR